MGGKPDFIKQAGKKEGCRSIALAIASEGKTSDLNQDFPFGLGGVISLLEASSLEIKSRASPGSLVDGSVKEVLVLRVK